MNSSQRAPRSESSSNNRCSTRLRSTPGPLPSMRSSKEPNSMGGSIALYPSGSAVNNCKHQKTGSLRYHSQIVRGIKVPRADHSYQPPVCRSTPRSLGAMQGAFPIPLFPKRERWQRGRQEDRWLLIAKEVPDQCECRHGGVDALF
jgi:hypothetical protein